MMNIRKHLSALHTQQLTQDYLELTQSSHAVHRLSAKRLGRGDTLGRTTRRSSFLGHLRKPFFCVRMIIKQFKEQYSAIERFDMRQMQTLAFLLRDLHRKSVVPVVQNVPVVPSLLAVQGPIELKVQ
jgi:hypothetical protein